jgi:PAS domain S-box-containing protein
MKRPVVPSTSRLAQLVLESATDFAIITTDLEGAVTSWNPGAVNLLGWSERDAVGRDACMIFPPEDDAHAICWLEMDTARATGRAEDERWHVRADGSRFWASGLMMRLEDDSSGAHLGYLKILRDRTAQHAADEALRASEALTRSLFESSADCVKILDLDGRLSEMNGPGLRIMEIEDLSLFIGQDWKTLWPAESQPDLSRALAEARAGRVGRFYGRCPTAKGTLKWWDVQVSPVLNFDGRPAKLLAVSRDVTQRAGADAALRDSELRILDLAAQQTATLSQLAEGVVVTDVAGRITLVNDAAARIHGVARLDVAPDDYTQTYSLLTEDGRPYPSLDLPLARAVRGETVMDARWRIRRPDGDEVLAVGNARPVRDSEGRQIGAVLTLRDDTARVAAESALSESEARLRTLTDNLPSGMVYQISMKRDGSERRFVYVSQSHVRLTGVPAEAAMADPSVPYNLILPEHRAALAAAEAVAIRDLSAFDVEAPFRRADTGEVRWSRMVSAPREMPDGTLMWDGIQIDITDRKQAEDASRASEARLSAILSQASAGIASTGRTGRYTYVNDRYCAMLGRSREELLALTMQDVTHPDDLARTRVCSRSRPMAALHSRSRSGTCGRVAA